MSVKFKKDRLALPQVTVCAVTSVNVQATVRALKACIEQIAFGECLLFTNTALDLDDYPIRVVPIENLETSSAYSEFLLNRLVDHVETSHCLIVQWDGHVLDAERWRPDFLACDYIGASWPQFDDGYDVGNGGFSLRSQRLMELCRSAFFQQSHPEDVAIGRANREWLERQGIQFASQGLADAFSAERKGNPSHTFGYHGAFNMPRALGADAFWDVYRSLDDISTIKHDFRSIAKGMWPMRGAITRIIRMAAQCLWYAVQPRTAPKQRHTL